MRTSTSTELRNELADIVTCQDEDGEDEEEEEDPEEEREDEEQEEDRDEGKVDKYYLGLWFPTIRSSSESMSSADR